MEKLVVQLFVLALIGLPVVEARARTIRTLRSLKDFNIGRLRTERRLDDFSLSNNPLIYSAEKQEPGSGGENNHHFMMLSYEISTRNGDVKHLSDYVTSVQKKVDDLSETVVDRITEINNLITTQLLGQDGI